MRRIIGLLEKPFLTDLLKLIGKLPKKEQSSPLGYVKAASNTF
jgi:hypothetical protein